VKVFLFKLRHFSWIENSIFLFSLLLVTTIVLLCYIFTARTEITKTSEMISKANWINVEALSLSKIGYKSQLELFTYRSLKDDAHYQRYVNAEKEFQRQFEKTIHLMQVDNEMAVPGFPELIDELKAGLPAVEQARQRVVQGVQAGVDRDGLKLLMTEAENRFDKLGFDTKMEELMKRQGAKIIGLVDHINELRQNFAFLVMLGLALSLFQGILVTFIHRSAMQGKTHQLQLIQASKLAALGELSAGVAHELNNPLMFIKGFNGRVAASLKKVGFDAGSVVWDYIKEVDAGVQRMQNIVVHFRDFSRSSGHERQPVEINQVVKRSFTLIEEQLRLKSIDVKLDLSEENPIVFASDNRLEQVVLNLISNSRDALADLPEGKPRQITIQTLIYHHKMVLEFSDTGPGIEKADLARIFDPFFTTKPVGQGTGLGLSVSQGIITDYGGEIRVTSEVGQGARFTITLPIHQQKQVKKAC